MTDLSRSALFANTTGASRITEAMVDEALATFIVAMQRTGTTREGLRAVLEACIKLPGRPTPPRNGGPSPAEGWVDAPQPGVGEQV